MTNKYLFINIYIFYVFIYFFQFPRAVNIKKKMKLVGKGHGVDSEIGNVSARQAALNHWTATDLYLFINIYYQITVDLNII